MSGLARPVRILDSAFFSASCALAMSVFNSAKMSSIMRPPAQRELLSCGETNVRPLAWPAGASFARLCNQRSDVVALDDTLNVAAFGEREHPDRELVVATQRDRRAVHHTHAILDEAVVAEPPQHLCIGKLGGVLREHAGD